MGIEWTRPYLGVQHTNILGGGIANGWWCTVVDRGGMFAELAKHFPGCGFYPTTSHHDTVEEAKIEAERWLDGAGA
jgi:hypothetical protein